MKNKMKSMFTLTTAMVASVVCDSAQANNSVTQEEIDARIKGVIPAVVLLLQDEKQVIERSVFNVDLALIDNAMAYPVPDKANAYTLGGPGNYGANAPLALFLTLLAYDDPEKESSRGQLVMGRAIEHLKATVSKTVYPKCRGGHASWFDMYLPVALGVARQTPAMWDQFDAGDRKRSDILMRQCLHAANIFLNVNDALGRSNVFLDMAMTPSGSLPNQSGSYHAYGIGAYMYFGGTEGMNAQLEDLNYAEFQSELRSVDVEFEEIAKLYDNEQLIKLLDGQDPKVENGRGGFYTAQPDVKGVRKPLEFLNTRSLAGSPAGKEHSYSFGKHEKLAATPANIFQRWGHEFAVGAMPQANVGPNVVSSSKPLPCDNINFGLVGVAMPFEGEGKGMPYELNARSGPTERHSRSSWDYASWGVQQYTYLFAALSITGYWDVNNPKHREIIKRADKAKTIWRLIGESGKDQLGKGWLSSAGPAHEVCTRDHGDAYERFGGNHWGQGMMDGLFPSQGEYKFTFAPLVE